ncbi:MAG TPA: septation regulator SpoVG [Vicinamibacteria bacterium]|nr:septation regulator SpoVG [Vicinamibacteria bacterium]
MEITEVRIFPVDDEKLKAFVSIILDDCFVISDIKIIHGPKGLFVSMPSKKRKDGTFRDIAHPLNSDTRRKMEDHILNRYRVEVDQAERLEPRALPGERIAVRSSPSAPSPTRPSGVSEA